MTETNHDSHVVEELAAYADGELTPADSRRVGEHIKACRVCRQEYEQIRWIADVTRRRLPVYRAPDGLWDRFETELLGSAAGGQTGVRTAVPESGRRRRWILACAAAAVLAALSLSIFQLSFAPRREHLVFRLEGAPQVEGQPIPESSPLAVGQSLTTDSGSRARIEITKIGEVVVQPRSRVRLLENSPREHRLALDVGGIEATISAPPRLFFVETPGALAIDLGCAYTLDVDETGDGLLHVRAGWVGLERGLREVVAPAGTACRISRQRGPGFPYLPDAAPEFLGVLFELESRPAQSSDLTRLLANARPADTLSLWYLAQDLPHDLRTTLLKGMLQLAPPPALEATSDGLVRFQPQAWLQWRDHLEQLAASAAVSISEN